MRIPNISTPTQNKPTTRQKLPAPAESVIRGWFELEPEGKGIIIASFTE